MIKRTLFFANPCYLSIQQKQMQIKQGNGQVTTVPVEDVGFVVLENQQITLSMPLLNALAENNVAVIFCNNRHMPHSQLFPLEGNHVQGEMHRQQAMASEPLKKQLWKQTVEAKITNQAALLKRLGKQPGKLNSVSKEVKSGDSTGREGLAARIYWQEMFGNGFTRDRFGAPPNHLLNYGYIILRAAVARALTGSGMLPSFGIFHHNRYNAYCLADDIMEPYRPFTDALVYELWEKYPGMAELSTEIKARLLEVLTTDVAFDKFTRPLMVGLSQTTASLARCFAGEQRKIEYPGWP